MLAKIKLLNKIYLNILRYIPLLLILYFFYSMSANINISITKKITDLLILNNNTLKTIFYYILLYVIINSISILLLPIISIISEKIQFIITRDASTLLYQQLSNIDINNFDHSNFLNKLKRSCMCNKSLFFSLFETNIKLISYLFSFLFLLILILKIHYIYIFLFFLMGITQVLYIRKKTAETITISRFTDSMTRKNDYFLELMRNRVYAKEIRSNNLFQWIDKKRKISWEKIKQKHIAVNKRWGIISSLWSCIMYFFEALILVICIYQFKHDKINISDIIALTQLQSQFLNLFSIIVDMFSVNQNNFSYLDDYFDIINFNLEKTTNYHFIQNHNKKVILEIKSLRYSYYANKYVINSISLDIKKNEKICIIGQNGSGKSTLIKLISNLLNFNEGEIINYTSNISAVYQDFCKYNLTYRENVGIGEISNLENDNYIFDLSKKCNLDYLVKGFENGLDTILGKDFQVNGLDLSYGEWQKIAICRSLFDAKSELIIFDEPTSALDPIAELKQFNYIYHQLENKTVIFISHRVGLAKLADRIIFLKDGFITESGSHTDLLKIQGDYYNFYTKQSKWYDEDKL